MQSINLNVRDEEQLYSSFDPQGSLLSEETKAYLLSELRAGGRKDGMGLNVISESPMDEERFVGSIRRWIDDEQQSIQISQRRNSIQQLWMFGIGLAFVTLSLVLQPLVNVVWFTVLSTIGAFAIWEAAGFWIVRNPELRIRKRMVERLGDHITCQFSVHERKAAPDTALR